MYVKLQKISMVTHRKFKFPKTDLPKSLNRFCNCFGSTYTLVNFTANAIKFVSNNKEF